MSSSQTERIIYYFEAQNVRWLAPYLQPGHTIVQGVKEKNDLAAYTVYFFKTKRSFVSKVVGNFVNAKDMNQTRYMNSFLPTKWNKNGLRPPCI